MPLKHSCFISYRRGQHELTQHFIGDLKKALADYLEPYTDMDIYIDNNLEPGVIFPDQLAKELCQSVCMILVFTPKYFDFTHTYCAREYKAMEKIEKERLDLLGSIAKEHIGLIIPIVFRGFDSLPAEIKSIRSTIDFSTYTLLDIEMSKNPKYVDEINKIAAQIYSLCEKFETLQQDPCSGCLEFKLPSDDEIAGWLRTIRITPPPFPGR